MPGVEYWLFSTGKENDLGGGLYKKQAQEGPRNYVHVESVDEAIITFQQAGGSYAKAGCARRWVRSDRFGS